MLQFIKGVNLSSYNALLEKTSDYNDAFFLDTTNTRLYFDGKPVDVRINVINQIDENFINKKSYQFVNNDGDTTIISDAMIPELDETKVILHDVDTQEDIPHSNGLMSVKDKYLIEAITKALKIKIKYTYYAHVHHVEDIDNHNFDIMKDVFVYQNDGGEWVYDYESYQYPYYTQDKNGNYISKGTLTKEAGSAPVEEEDVRVQAIEIVRASDATVYFDGNGREETQETITNHGGIPAGTTVEDLEKKTVSEVLGDILFEVAKPVKVNDNKAYIKFADGTEYQKYVEVGAPYPTIGDFETIFTPETWQWQSVVDASVVGEPQPLTQYVSTKYYLHDFEHPWHPGHGQADPSWDIYDVESNGYAEHYAEYTIVDGDKCVYTGVITYEKFANAKDSLGKETYELDGSTYYYAQGKDGSVNSTNELRFKTIEDDTIDVTYSIIAGWKIYTNASNVSTGSLWSVKNEEPSAYTGVDEMTDSEIFAEDGMNLYVQWPSATSASEKFYVYIPEGYAIKSVGGAHDMIKDNWTAKLTATPDSSLVEVTNKYNAVGKYQKYEISKSSGITVAKIDIEKISD